MNFTLPHLIVWLIVGALAGNLAGRLVTLTKHGLGQWTNLGVGMAGALIGGVIFNLFNIPLGFLNELTISFAELVEAFIGSLLFVFAWWLVSKIRAWRKR